jgi:hypothetical protein
MLLPTKNIEIGRLSHCHPATSAVYSPYRNRRKRHDNDLTRRKGSVHRAGVYQDGPSPQLVRIVGVVGLGLAGRDSRIIALLTTVEGIVGTDAAGGGVGTLPAALPKHLLLGV